MQIEFLKTIRIAQAIRNATRDLPVAGKIDRLNGWNAEKAGWDDTGKVGVGNVKRFQLLQVAKDIW